MSATLAAVAQLQRAGFRSAGSLDGALYLRRDIGPFAVEAVHDSITDSLALRIAPLPDAARYRPWSVPLSTPEAVAAEALNFIRVFEFSAAVGGD